MQNNYRRRNLQTASRDDIVTDWWNKRRERERERNKKSEERRERDSEHDRLATTLLTTDSHKKIKVTESERYVTTKQCINFRSIPMRSNNFHQRL